MDAADEACRNCGAPVPKLNRSWSKFAKISVVTLVVAIFAAYFIMHNMGMINYDFIEDVFTGSSSETLDDIPPEDDGSGAFAEQGVDNDNTEVVSYRRSHEEHIEILHTIHYAANAYLREISHHSPVISNSGYLYNAGDNLPITLEMLTAFGFLDQYYDGEEVLLLYLRPMDMSPFEEVALDHLSQTQRDRMTVFLAYPTPVGFGLLSDHGEHIIYRENLNLLLLSYTPTLFDVVRPQSSDEVYRAVADMILDENDTHDDGRDVLFIRHLAVDDAHGFASFSFGRDPSTIHNLIFALEEDAELTIRLVARDFDSALHPKAAINSAAPNFNFNLLPNYDISRTDISEPAVFTEILHTMRQNGQLYEDAEPLFISASDAFAYIITNAGSAFLGHFTAADGWSIVPVDNWMVAEQLMSDFTHNPPLYIIWQQ